MLSRKDYELLARNAAQARRDHQAAPTELYALDSFLDNLCLDLKRDNPAFNPIRFLEACERKPE